MGLVNWFCDHLRLASPSLCLKFESDILAVDTKRPCRALAPTAVSCRSSHCFLICLARKTSYIPPKVAELVIRNARSGNVNCRNAGYRTAAAYTPTAPRARPAVPPTAPPLSVSLWQAVSDPLCSLGKGGLRVVGIFFFFGENLHGCGRRRGGSENAGDECRNKQWLVPGVFRAGRGPPEDGDAVTLFLGK